MAGFFLMSGSMKRGETRVLSVDFSVAGGPRRRRHELPGAGGKDIPRLRRRQPPQRGLGRGQRPWRTRVRASSTACAPTSAASRWTPSSANAGLRVRRREGGGRPHRLAAEVSAAAKGAAGGDRHSIARFWFQTSNLWW